MLWFKKKSKAQSITPAPVRETKIKQHEAILDAAVSDANRASTKVTRLIENNGFTVIIAASMGARRQRGANSHGH